MNETDRVDHTIPDGAWRFDEGVTDVFENMLARSIPQYDVMRQTVTDLAIAYAEPFRDRLEQIVDLGCSRGDALAPLIDHFGLAYRYVGVDVSEPMLAAARKRFAGLIERNYVSIRQLDLRTDYPSLPPAAVTLAVLTLMFVPLEHRQRVVRSAYRATVPGGAFIVVEKVLGETAELDATFTSRYLRLKAANGYSAEEIERKALSLEGVLVPVTAAWDIDLLRRAGFETVDCFWRWANFAGFIAIKEPRP